MKFTGGLMSFELTRWICHYLTKENFKLSSIVGMPLQRQYLEGLCFGVKLYFLPPPAAHLISSTIHYGTVFFPKACFEY